MGYSVKAKGSVSRTCGGIKQLLVTRGISRWKAAHSRRDQHWWDACVTAAPSVTRTFQGCTTLIGRYLSRYTRGRVRDASGPRKG